MRLARHAKLNVRKERQEQGPAARLRDYLYFGGGLLPTFSTGFHVQGETCTKPVLAVLLRFIRG